MFISNDEMHRMSRNIYPEVLKDGVDINKSHRNGFLAGMLQYRLVLDDMAKEKKVKIGRG